MTGAKLDERKKLLEEWKEYSIGMDFEEYNAGKLFI